jgi:hypothetical protein
MTSRCRVDVEGDRDERVPDDTDAVGVGDCDGRGQEARLSDPLEAGQLAIAVEGVTTSEDRLPRCLARSGDDDRHTGPDRSAADDERAVAAHERRVPDANAGDVRDRVERPGRAETDDDAEVAGSHVHLRNAGQAG